MFDIRIRPKILLLIAILVSGLLIIFYSLPKGSIHYQICDKKSDESLRNDVQKTEKETPAQMMAYLLWTNRSSCRLAHDFGGHMLKNPSGLDGQKCLCLDPVSVAPKPKSCIVYSFGINNEWSFDESMEKYGCQVYAFDPSMKKEDHDRSPSIHFYNIGLNARDSEGAWNKTGAGGNKRSGWRFLTLESIHRMLRDKHGDVAIDYLKIDIENDEWVVLPHILSTGMMDRVKQLAVEVHFSDKMSRLEFRNRIEILRSVESYGMIRFDSKYNPWFKGTFTQLTDEGEPKLSASRGYEIAWYNSKFL